MNAHPTHPERALLQPLLQILGKATKLQLQASQPEGPAEVSVDTHRRHYRAQVAFLGSQITFRALELKASLLLPTQLRLPTHFMRHMGVYSPVRTR
jgi:hypothetical protein